MSRNRPMSPASCIVCGALSALLGLCIVIYGIYQFARVSSARSWTTTPGRIAESHVEKTGGKGKSRRFHATYEYTVNGSALVGTRVAVGSNPRTADMVGKYPAGASCQVLYNPDDSSDCALEVGGHNLAWIGLGIGAVALGSGIFTFMRGLLP